MEHLPNRRSCCIVLVLLSFSGCCKSRTSCCPGAASDPRENSLDMRVRPREEKPKWELIHESQGGEVMTRAGQLLGRAGIEFGAWGGKVFEIVVHRPDAAKARKILLTDPLTRRGVIPPE
jgi:hypothetical protein